MSEAETDLYSLNYLTGTNSSGKSSYLQSLLLLVQSLEDDINLNGRLTRLGEAIDIVKSKQDVDSEKSDDQSLAFSYKVSSTDNEESPIEVNMKLTPTKVRDKSRFFLSELKVADGDEVILHASDKNVGAVARAELKKYISRNDSLLKVKTYKGVNQIQTWVVFRGFLPAYLVVKRKQGQVKNNIASVIHSESISLFAHYKLQSLVAEFVGKKQEIPPSVVDFSRQDPFEWKNNKKTTKDNATQFISDYYFEKNDAVQAVPILSRVESGLGMSNLEDYDYILAGDKSFFFSATDFEIKRNLEKIGSMLHEILRNIIYVGPLREEPQVLSLNSGMMASAPVGVKGELTAEFLLKNGDSDISYYNSEFVRKSGKLFDAINEWVDYLDIGQKIQTRDEGKLGRGIVLSLKNETASRDLTQIGVGASQLLPILTAVLGSPEGSIILLEQPELHLHPAVQSRIADFFLAQSQLKGFIVETHSEYLITRSRLHRIKKRSGSESIKFYFVEVDKAGDHKFKKLSENRYGDLECWPAGFFDTLESDTREIVAAVRDEILGK